MKLLILLALFLLPPYGAFREPEFIQARHVRIVSLGVKESRIRADLYYFNPNRMRLKLRSADLDVYINNKFAGKSLLDTLVQVPARDTFSVPVTVNVDMRNVFPTAFALLLRDSVDLKLVGKLNVAKGPLTIQVPVKYSEKIAMGR